MKKFKLETLLKLKQNRENTEVIKLAELKKIENQLFENLKIKEKELSSVEKELENITDTSLIKNTQKYIKHLFSDIEDINREIILNKEKIEKQKLNLQKATVEKKKIEEFKKIFSEKIKLEEEKRENNFLSEFSIIAFNRRLR